MVQPQPIALSIADIRIDGGTQPRAELSADLVAEYAAALLCGDAFPPITVFYDGADYWLADGFHRLEAHRQHGTTEIEPDIRQGTRRDAVLYACGANAKHGLRRTNADKRRAVETLLHDTEWAQWSDREIARRCAVTQPFVSKIRDDLSDNGYQIEAPRLASRNGTTYEINTNGIGRNGHAPPPDEEDDEQLSPYEQGLAEQYQATHTPEAAPPTPDPMAVHYTSDSPEWYTPRDIIDRAIVVLGQIDLDPCSNSADRAKANVPAGDYFHKEKDGLAHQWFGRVYMNPPYGDEIADWAERLIWHYDHDYVDEAIALIPARTDTAWFRPFKKRFPCCFINGRLKFISPDGAKNSAPFPSVVVYLGLENKIARFEEIFGEIGDVMLPFGLRND